MGRYDWRQPVVHRLKAVGRVRQAYGFSGNNLPQHAPAGFALLAEGFIPF